jgi:hypothetical protein
VGKPSSVSDVSSPSASTSEGNAIESPSNGSNETDADNGSHLEGIDFSAHADAPNLSLTELSGQFELLHNTRDTNKDIQVVLNGKSEMFIMDLNVINGSRGRKMFKRVGDNIKELYWYITYGAFMNVKTGKFFVTPCGFTGTDLVLVAILETRCNNPHYEALVCNKVTNEVTILKKDSKWVTIYECDLSIQFDDVTIRR